jgi:hypothetical protein
MLGFQPGRRHALVAGLVETGGGLLLALGLLTPVCGGTRVQRDACGCGERARPEGLLRPERQLRVHPRAWYRRVNHRVYGDRARYRSTRCSDIPWAVHPGAWRHFS